MALCLILVAVVVTACTGADARVRTRDPAPEGINVGNKAREFTLESLDGSDVALSDYKGDVVLVNFWATWCPPCRAEIPDFEAVYRAHKDEGFVVLGVNEEQSLQVVERFVAGFDMTYPVLLDKRGQVMDEYRGPGLPMSLLVDRRGVIQLRHMGILTAAQLEKHLAKALSEDVVGPRQ